MTDAQMPPAPAAAGGAVVPAGGTATVGKVRSTATCFVLTIVTLGIYTWAWYFKTSSEMRRHTGEGIGGGIALVLVIFISVVMPFVSAHEVGRMYERRGQQAPVTAATGLWALLLGWFFLVGLVVWFVKTNSALNEYWRSLGAS
jgi:Na+-transporting NADH:ubiquinone oxidoreductase subunit NqrD